MKAKIEAFWREYGYVCVLLTCVGLVAVTALLTGEKDTKAIMPTPTGSVRSVTIKPMHAESTPSPVPTAAVPEFIFPCGGEPIRDYSIKEPVWQPTLGEYAVHSGIDFSGDLGEPIWASEKGTVTRVWQDSLWGWCVEVTHRHGYRTRYCSLMETPVVKEGDRVERGQALGEMGTSSSVENSDGAHLHFELFRLQNRLDPELYLTEPLT